MQKLIDVTDPIVKDVLPILLQDKTTEKNIIWATDAYTDFDEKTEINKNDILNRPNIICPRVLKSKEEQIARSRKKAEVFTPAWLVNKMNNFIDEDWFQRKNVFNAENNDNTWTTNEEKIEFPLNSDWKNYIDSKRLEIACGEAPYIVSRYDAVNGNFILPKNRIGILDRKMKIVNQNTTDISDWKIWTFRAFKSVYGYEYQGDNTLIARINLLMSFVEYFEEKFGIQSNLDMIEDIAKIIAKNIWQMDGLTNNKPLGAPYKQYIQPSLFDCNEQITVDIPSKIFDYKENKYILFSKLKEMKSVGKKLFDYVIGNPPYQEEDGGAAASAKPVYQYFCQAANDVAKKCVCLIMPARWYAGGKGLDEFRDKMLSDPTIKVLCDFPDTNEVFPKVNIRGGVCIVLWDKNYDNKTNKTKMIISEHGMIKEYKRNLKYKDFDIFIRNQEAISILEKVGNKAKNLYLADYVSPRRPFGIGSEFSKTENFQKSSDSIEEPIICIGKRLQRGYIDKKFVNSHTEWINIWKVFVPRANNIGTELNDDNLNSFVGEPNEICTEAYMVIGMDLHLDKKSATALRNYLQTKFVRFLHSLAKSSQDASSKTYRFVPLQDFTKNSDIDWTKSVAEIDKQLYKKYGLSEEEIEFIETHVKEMA